MTSQVTPGRVQAKATIGRAVMQICDAELLLEDAARMAPEVADELARLVQVLHNAGVQALEARGLLEKEKEKES